MKLRLICIEWFRLLVYWAGFRLNRCDFGISVLSIYLLLFFCCHCFFSQPFSFAELVHLSFTLSAQNQIELWLRTCTKIFCYRAERGEMNNNKDSVKQLIFIVFVASVYWKWCSFVVATFDDDDDDDDVYVWVIFFSLSFCIECDYVL